MPRHCTAAEHESVPRPVVVVSNEHPAGARGIHVHRRAQLLCTTAGVVTVWTEQGTWVAPPQRAVWIPPGVRHAIRMGGPASTCSAYLQWRAAEEAGLPDQCRVLAVSPLLRALLETAVDLPLHYGLAGRAGRVMALIVDEIRELVPVRPLHVPMPAEPRLARVCGELIANPAGRVGVDAVARRAGMSRSTFVRRFREATGTSFGQWNRQVCLLAALARLGAGEPVTRVAMDLGYDSPSAFTAQFRRALGVPPSRYFASTRAVVA